MDAKNKKNCCCPCQPDSPNQGAGNGIQHELRISALEEQVRELAGRERDFSWDAIEGKPVAAPEAIDKAVDESHAHKNLGCLAKLGGDGKGNLTYGGKPVARDWIVTINEGEALPGNMAAGALVVVKNPETGKITGMGLAGENGELLDVPANVKPEDLKLADGSSLGDKLAEIEKKVAEANSEKQSVIYMDEVPETAPDGLVEGGLIIIPGK